MTKLTAAQIDALIEEMALRVKAYLKTEKCVREADNLDPKTATVEEICEGCDIPPSMWCTVKERAWELGIPLTHGYFSAYYLGNEGEQSRCIVQYYMSLRGQAKAACRGLMALGKSGTLQDGIDYARQMIGIPLTDVPKLMKALDIELPDEAVQLLLESGELPD